MKTKPTKANIRRRIENAERLLVEAHELAGEWQPRGRMHDRKRDLRRELTNATAWARGARELLEV